MWQGKVEQYDDVDIDREKQPQPVGRAIFKKQPFLAADRV